MMQLALYKPARSMHVCKFGATCKMSTTPQEQKIVNNYCPEHKKVLKKDGSCPSEHKCADVGTEKCVIKVNQNGGETMEQTIEQEPTPAAPATPAPEPETKAPPKAKAKKNNAMPTTLPKETQLNSYGFIKVPSETIRRDLGFEQVYKPGNKANNQGKPVFPIIDVILQSYDRKTKTLVLKVVGLNRDNKRMTEKELAAWNA